MANLTRRSGEEYGLSRWDPFDVVRELSGWDPFQEMERLGSARGFLPSFDVRETPDAYVFRADLPGVKEDNLDIVVTGNRLTISGKREQEEKREGEKYYAFERSYGTFARTFTLPDGVDLEHIEAELKDGVLTLVVPKSEHAKPKRISVKGLKEGVKGITEKVVESVKEIKEKVAGKAAS